MKRPPTPFHVDPFHVGQEGESAPNMNSAELRVIVILSREMVQG